jgi:hypothetical protein
VIDLELRLTVRTLIFFCDGTRLFVLTVGTNGLIFSRENLLEKDSLRKLGFNSIKSLSGVQLGLRLS